MLITSGHYKVYSGTKSYLNPIQPNIRMHILYTVLYTFLKVLAGGLATTTSLVCDHFLYSHYLKV